MASDAAPPPARSRGQRRQDALDRLAGDVDVWVATADSDGTPYLVPLSFVWNGDELIIATPESSPTGRNLRATGRVRLAVGPTRDVVMIEGSAETVPIESVDAALGDAFATKTGFDPRTLSTRYGFFRIRPRRLQAWREANELAGRELLRDGNWLD